MAFEFYSKALECSIIRRERNQAYNGMYVNPNVSLKSIGFSRFARYESYAAERDGENEREKLIINSDASHESTYGRNMLVGQSMLQLFDENNFLLFVHIGTDDAAVLKGTWTIKSDKCYSSDSSESENQWLTCRGIEVILPTDKDYSSIGRNFSTEKTIDAGHAPLTLSNTKQKAKKQFRKDIELDLDQYRQFKTLSLDGSDVHGRSLDSLRAEISALRKCRLISNYRKKKCHLLARQASAKRQLGLTVNKAKRRSIDAITLR